MKRTRGKGGSAETGPDTAPDDAAASTPSAAPDGAPHAGPEATVAAYLLTHPDFFVQHPEVLTQLRLPHPSGAAVSLIERQVSVLRTQLETERHRLAQLIARAREYESFSARLHALVLALIVAENLEQVQDVLAEGLMREFSAQAVTLRFFAPSDANAAADGDPAAAFRDFLARQHALCGPLDAAKNAILFGDPSAPTAAPPAVAVRCAALVPIHAHGRAGVLAIGAADPDRFKPDMRTDLLDRLGEIVSRKLMILPTTSVTPAPTAPTPAAGTAPPPPKRKRTRRTVPE